MFGRKSGLPEHWEAAVAGSVPGWAAFTAEDRADYADALQWAMRDLNWEPVAGFALTDDMRVVLAAPVALLVLGLDVDQLRAVDTILVWPHAVAHQADAIPVIDTVRMGGYKFVAHNDPYTVAGPLALSWEQVQADAAHPERGRSTVMRAFALRIDVSDGSVDAVPLLAGRVDRERWVAVLTEVFDALDQGDERPPLDPSGGADAGAFFGVATESFFLRPIELQANEPALYELLVAFYDQDPAARVR